MARPTQSELHKRINTMRTRAWFRSIQWRSVQSEKGKKYFRGNDQALNGNPTQRELLDFLSSTADIALDHTLFSRWQSGKSTPTLKYLNLFSRGDAWPFLKESSNFFWYGPGDYGTDESSANEDLKRAPIFFALSEEEAFNLVEKMPESFRSAFVEIAHGLGLSSVFENIVLETERSAAKFGMYPTIEEVLAEATPQYRLAQLAGCFMLLRFLVVTLHKPMYVVNALKALLRSESVKKDLEEIAVSPDEYAELMTLVLQQDLRYMKNRFGEKVPALLKDLEECCFSVTE